MPAYSFQDVTCTLVGPTGSADLGYGSSVAEEGISFEMAGEKNKMTVGGDGKVMHSLAADKTGNVTVRLLKTSPLNAILMAYYDAQTATASLHGQNVIVCRQNASGDTTTAIQCAFKKKPPIRYAKDGDILEWTFDSAEIDSILGTY